jgi:hypothetical protein
VGSLAVHPVLPDVQTKESKVRMTFRLERSDVEHWQALATSAKLTLSEWVRRKCNGQASNLTSAAEKKGMTAEWIADKIHAIIENPDTYPRDMVAALKTLIAARGEETGSSTQSVVNLRTPKALIIVGTDPQSVAKMIGKGA